MSSALSTGLGWAGPTLRPWHTVRVLATLLNETAAAEGGNSFVQILTVLVVFAVVWPLLTRLRRTLSERRRERWAAENASNDEDSTPPL